MGNILNNTTGFLFNGLKNEKLWIYGISILFLAVHAYYTINNESLLFLAFPFMLAMLYLGLFHLNILFFIVTFCIPLSIPLSDLVGGLSIDMALPTEPVMFFMLLIILIKLLKDNGFDKKLLKHPLTVVILINLAWILITSIFSTMPVVSFKFFLARLWFIMVFYFLAFQLFKNYKNIDRYFWVYMIPLTIVIFYTVFKQVGYGLLNQKAAHSAMVPFFNDHTSYGAILAMYIPVLFFYVFRHHFNNNFTKAWAFVLLVIFFIAEILSYSRAAWVSIVVAFMLWILMKLKIRPYVLFTLAGILVMVFFAFQNQIIYKLESNQEESSSNIMTHVYSISNITSDASNVERINRWASAIKMFEEKPFLGWGPGTYMFQYAPFQLSRNLTIISTNTGDMGNAHSEFLGPLAESGILGTLTFVLIVIFSIITGSKIFFRARSNKIKYLALGILLGLITYFAHGLLNNFLDTDKASGPFWGFLAVLVILDVYYKEYADEALSAMMQTK